MSQAAAMPTSLTKSNTQIEGRGSKLRYTLLNSRIHTRGGSASLCNGKTSNFEPRRWEHINLTGDYVWRSSAKVGAGKFRPLRPLPGASLA